MNSPIANAPQPRIAPLEPPYSEEVTRALDVMMPAGTNMEPLRIFRTLARSPSIGKRVARLGGGLLSSRSVPAREREIIILRTTARAGAEYEWGVHVTWMAQSVGLTSEQVNALATSTALDPIWTTRDSLLIRLTDELYDTKTLSDELWTALRAEWSEPILLEMIVAAGFYQLISLVVNASRVDNEPWAASLPRLTQDQAEPPEEPA